MKPINTTFKTKKFFTDAKIHLFHYFITLVYGVFRLIRYK